MARLCSARKSAGYCEFKLTQYVDCVLFLWEKVLTPPSWSGRTEKENCLGRRYPDWIRIGSLHTGSYLAPIYRYVILVVYFLFIHVSNWVTNFFVIFLKVEPMQSDSDRARWRAYSHNHDNHPSNVRAAVSATITTKLKAAESGCRHPPTSVRHHGGTQYS